MSETDKKSKSSKASKTSPSRKKAKKAKSSARTDTLKTALAKRKKEQEKHIALIEKELKKRPGDPDLHTELGVGYASIGEMDKAADEWRLSMELSPRQDKARYLLHLFHTARGDPVLEREAHEKVLKKDPLNVDAHIGVAMSLARQGNTREAIRRLKRVTGKIKDSMPLHYNLGVLFASMGELADATRHYREAVRLSGDDHKIRLNLALLLMRRGLWKEAQKEFLSVLEADPENHIARLHLATLYERDNDLESAERQLRKLLLQPQFEVQARFQMGRIRWSQGRPGESEQHLLTVLQSDPDHRAALLILRDLYEEHCEWKKLAEVSRRLLDIMPHDKKTTLALGHALFHTGKLEEAIKILKKLVRERPDFTKAYEILALSLMQVEKYRTAMKYTKEALNREPDNPELNLVFAFLLAWRKDFKKSKNILEKILKKHPNNHSIQKNLGVILFRAGDYDMAKKYFENVFLLDNYRPGSYNIKLEVLSNNKLVYNDVKQFNIQTIKNIAYSNKSSKTIFGKFVTLKAINKGNDIDTAVFESSLDKSWYVFYAGPKGEVTNNKISWKTDIDAGETIEIKYSEIYWPTYIIIISAVLIGLFLYLTFTSLAIRKSIAGRNIVEKDKSMSVSITVKNRIREMTNVVVKDFIPKEFEILGKFETIKPILRKTSNGIELTWKLGRLKSYEQRILHYKIKPKKLIKKMNLPSATVTAKYFNKTIIKKSNRVAVYSKKNIPSTLAVEISE